MVLYMSIKRPRISRRTARGATKFFNGASKAVSHTFSAVLHQPEHLIKAGGTAIQGVSKELELPLIVGGLALVAYFVFSRK